MDLPNFLGSQTLKVIAEVEVDKNSLFFNDKSVPPHAHLPFKFSRICKRLEFLGAYPIPMRSQQPYRRDKNNERNRIND